MDDSNNEGGSQPYNMPPLSMSQTGNKVQVGGARGMMDEWVYQNASKLNIDWNSLPKLGVWAPLMGYTDKWYRTEVAGRVIAAAYVLRRELTPPEREAVSQVAAKTCITRSWEGPTWGMLTYAFEVRGRSKMRFPFWTPKPGRLDPNLFPSKSRPLLRGVMANTMWNFTRVIAYSIPCSIAAKMFFGSMAISQFQSALRLDPRLKALREAGEQLGSQMVERVRQRSPQANVNGDQSTADEGNAAFEEAASRSSKPVGPPKPSSGPYARPSSQPTQPPSPPESVSTWADDDSLFDDASPVSASARQQQAASNQAAPRGGSSWEEIRRRAQTGGAPATTTRSQNAQVPAWAQRRRNAQQEEGTARKSEQEQAQKEFDALLEKERRGEQAS